VVEAIKLLGYKEVEEACVIHCLDAAVGKTVAKCPNCWVNNTFSIDIYLYLYFKTKYMPLSLHAVTNIL
jgi:hypothetical protein